MKYWWEWCEILKAINQKIQATILISYTVATKDTNSLPPGIYGFRHEKRGASHR